MKTLTSSPFSSESIQAAEKFCSEYRFYLEGIPVQITIRTYQSLNDDSFRSWVSHLIKTPKQACAYDSHHKDESEAAALQTAVQSFLIFYQEALSLGYEPHKNWLIENANR